MIEFFSMHKFKCAPWTELVDKGRVVSYETTCLLNDKRVGEIVIRKRLGPKATIYVYKWISRYSKRPAMLELQKTAIRPNVAIAKAGAKKFAQRVLGL